MADRATSRWPTVTGLWVGVATWLYAALAAYEVWDATRSRIAAIDGGVDHVRPPALAESLVDWTAVALGLVLVVSAGSLVTGRVRRVADLLLALGLGLGAALLWAAGEPERPVGPAVVGAAAVLVLVSVLLPARPAEGRLAYFGARLVLATVALLLGWVCAHELAKSHWHVEWTSSTGLYAIGVGVAALMLLAALLGPWLAHPLARWVFGLPTLLFGLFALWGGGMLFEEGRQLTGHVEDETGWTLGGAPAFLGAGLSAAGLALLRGRPTLGVGTVAAAVLAMLAILFGDPGIRNNF